MLLACTSCSCAEKYAIYTTVYVNTSVAVRVHVASETTTCEYRSIVCIFKAKQAQSNNNNTNDSMPQNSKYHNKVSWKYYNKKKVKYTAPSIRRVVHNKNNKKNKKHIEGEVLTDNI